MNYKDKIIQFLKENHGYICTADFKKLGIDKHLIPDYISDGIIRKVSHGIYIDNNLFEDPYYILQKRYSHIVFSYNTAFYILNLTNRTPHEIDVTVPQGKQVKEDCNVHYVSEKYYNIGIIVTDSPAGNPIKVYNAERSICDMLKNEDEFELELRNRILNYYFESKNSDYNKLLEYAELLGVYDKVIRIVEVMMKW